MKTPYARNTKVETSGLLVLLTLLVAVLALAGCGGTKATGADASGILAQAVPPMKALSSFHFTYKVVEPQGAPAPQGTAVVGLTGDVSLEGSMSATIDLLQNGVPLQFQFIATKDTHYIQNPASQKWQSVPAELSPVGRLNLSAGAIQILEKVQSPTEAGSETIDGVDCAKVKGKISAQDIANLVSAADTKDLLDCTLWIGTTDHLVRRIQTIGAATSGEDKRVQRLIELSKFNEPIKIEVPTSAS